MIKLKHPINVYMYHKYEINIAYTATSSYISNLGLNSGSISIIRNTLVVNSLNLSIVNFNTNDEMFKVPINNVTY
jgi:hypothetical protein